MICMKISYTKTVAFDCILKCYDVTEIFFFWQLPVPYSQLQCLFYKFTFIYAENVTYS